MFHVADNLRIFAERLEGVFAGAPTTLAAYDQDELATARNYEAMSLPSALWSVRTATDAWASATRESLTRPFTYQHAERGELNAAEITRGPGHDALHHYPTSPARCSSDRVDQTRELVVGVVVVHRRAGDRRRARAPRSRSGRSRWSTPRC